MACDKFSTVRDGDLVSVQADEAIPGRTILMRALYRCGDGGEFIVAVPFQDGQWVPSSIWLHRGNISGVGHEDDSLVAEAEADMPRFRREFVRHTCRQNERLLRTTNRELMRSLCAVGATQADFDGIAGGPDDDIEGIIAALVDIDGLETEWQSEPYTER